MNTEEWKKRIKDLWEKERQSIEIDSNPFDRTWHKGYQAALEDLYEQLEEEEDATL